MVLAINAKESASTVEEFLQAGDYSFPVLLDTTGVVGFLYNLQAVPKTFFIGKDGIIQFIQQGAFANIDEIEWSVKRLLE